MANDKGDINFGFDASGFEKAVKTMAGSLKTLETNTKNMVGKVGAGVTAGMSKVMIIFELIKKIGGGLGGAIKEFIPEIGAVMGMARNIIFKNLLFPLRQALLPILQKIMNWVRDNRKLFVELGGVLVNAFKMVKVVLMSVFNMVSPIINLIKKLLKSIFGDSVKSVAETLNMIMLKMMVFGMMVTNLLKPIFEGVASVIQTIMDVIGSFFSGFAKGFGGMDTAVTIVDALRLALEGIASVLRLLIPLFEKFGEVTGRAFRETGNIIKFLQGKEVKDWGVQSLENTFMTPDSKINDGVIQNGKVISTNPKDTLFAIKNPNEIGMNSKDNVVGNKKQRESVGVVIHVGGVNVTATEGNAVAVGENIIKGMERQIKNALLNSMTLEGV